MFVFVYGTLKQGHGNNYLLRNAKYHGPANINGFDLYHLGGYPGIIPGTGVVQGEYYEIDEGILRNLDSLEGVNHKNPEYGLYRRERVQVMLGKPYPDDELTAWVYVYNGDCSFRTKVESGKWR